MKQTGGEAPRRPDPDALLAELRQSDAAAVRGKLRIYFGSSAGVGKTYAMLAAARALQNASTNVLVGVVETHGRSATAELLAGLEVLPLQRVRYRDHELFEFDLDAALARKPALLLLDELAHTNAPGSRHAKRWQDAEELLAAGIDVFTTLNVQHLESLNDVVAGITGIRVAETLPDTFFDRADEVLLVDIPADELLARLKSGRIYRETQAAQAAQKFFRKGNLMALRELALRRTAERVEDDVQAYRRGQAIDPVWKTHAQLLACIGPQPGAEHVVRSAAQLANQLNMAWHAVYVETPRLQRLGEADRHRILRTMQLAQELGATTAVLAGDSVTSALTDYARRNNISKLMHGRRGTRRWPWPADLGETLARAAPEIDLIAVGLPRQQRERAVVVARSPHEGIDDAGPKVWPAYALTTLACFATALLATPLLPYLDLANIVMLFLLTVVLLALRFGRGPAVLAAVLQVALFDLFFVPPRFSFAVSDLQYLVTFTVMLLTALVVGQLTAGLRFQARVSTHRERRSRALYEFARELGSALQVEQVVQLARDGVSAEFRASVALFTLDDDDRLHEWPATSTDGSAPKVDAATAQWCLDHEKPTGFSTDTLAGSAYLYLPLKAPMRTRGVLAVRPSTPRLLLVPEQRQQLETFATLTATVLERIHYLDVAQRVTLHMESERLRNSLLAALSHDLRTPLAGLYGLSDTLAMSAPALSEGQRELAEAMRQETKRMHMMVNNLLDMARLQSGDVRLNLQWQPIEEVVGSAIAATRAALAHHYIHTELDADLPLVHFDAVLIERVLANLIENACKHTPHGTTITLAATQREDRLLVTVTDDGPGLLPDSEQALFTKFERRDGANNGGVGLGLAICQAIVSAHQGRIWAERAQSGGAQFAFTLPLGTPPSLTDDTADNVFADDESPPVEDAS